jgi:hypothetical protein
MPIDLVAPVALTLFVIGVLCKYAGVAEKLGKNFEYIMSGAVLYLLEAVLHELNAALVSLGIDITLVIGPIAAIVSVIAFICVAVGTILGAIALLRN